MDNSVFNNLFKSSSNASEVFSQAKKLPVKEYLPITLKQIKGVNLSIKKLLIY